MQNINDLINQNQGQNPTVGGPHPDMEAMLRQTTGLNMNVNPADLPSTQEVMKQQQQSVNQAASPRTTSKMESSQSPITTPTGPIRQESTPVVHIPAPTVETVQRPRASSLISADDFMKQAQQSGETVVEQKIDVEKEMVEEANRKMDQFVNAPMNNMIDALDDAVASEEARAQEAEEITSSQEEYQKFMGASADQQGDPNNIENMPVVRFERVKNTMIDGNRVHRTTDPILATAQQSDAVEDLLPSYEMNENEVAENEVDPTKEETVPDTSDMDEYAKYVLNLEEVCMPESDTVVKVIRDRQIDTRGSNSKEKFLNDQAFLNSINKFKRDNFATVSVPLVNSGFVAEVVGTGAVDLLQLYQQVNDQTSRLDYELEKLKIVMRNIVGTEPKVHPMDLRNMIHYQDYNMLAWALVCATLDTVESAATCQECGKSFRVSSSPKDMVINMPELETRLNEIRSAKNIEQYSLMTTDQVICTDRQFSVTLGHPSYAEYVRTVSQIRDILTSNDSMVFQRSFANVSNMLYYIRNIKMPNGVITANAYQHYSALQLLGSTELGEIEKCIDKMRSESMIPKFGFAHVTCPHCGKTLTNIGYQDIDEMLFFHTMVTTFRQMVNGRRKVVTSN